MKVIFLDIDGVLNTPSDFIELQKYGHPLNHASQVINRGCLAILQILVENTAAKIVFSSAWRREYNLDQFHEMFVIRGWSLSRDVMVGCTTTKYRDNDHRGNEIQQYLDDNLDIEKFVIIDDNIDNIERVGFKPLEVKSYETVGDFIETNPDSGITQSQALHASWLLGITPEAKEEVRKYNEALDLLAYSMV